MMIDDGMLLCAGGTVAWVTGDEQHFQEIQSRLNQSTGTTVSHFLK